MKPSRTTATMAGEASITRRELKTLVAAALEGKLSTHWCLHSADSKYYLPSLEEAKAIIDRSNMIDLAGPSGAKGRGECFDCDDFSLLLKARFAYAAYTNKEKHVNAPYCFGIAWGMLPFPFPHSLNWMVTDDRRLHFIEPQRQEIIPRERYANYRFINLMLV
jgi:hypothetical protein